MKSNWTESDSVNDGRGDSLVDHSEAPNLRLVGHEEAAPAVDPREELIQRGMQQLRLLRRQQAQRDAKQKRASVKQPTNVAKVEKVAAASEAPCPIEREPITKTDDARWVFAVRVSQAMQGSMLVPEKREKLIRAGRVMGLSPFDCNLIIAILQDQARRGNLPEYCPHLAQKQLEMISPVKKQGIFSGDKRTGWRVTAMLTGLLMVEGLLLLMIFR